MMNRSVFLLFIFLNGFLIGCKSKISFEENENQIKKIDSLFKAHFKQDSFSGGVVISTNNKTIYENYFGVADRTWNTSFNRNIKLDIASLNKSMISALVLKSVEENKLNLEDKLVNLLSDYSYQGNFHPDITIHQMLSHSSGLPDYANVTEDLKKNNFLKLKRLRFTDEEYVSFISNLKPINKPAQQFYYSNFAYHLIAIILADIYKKPFKQVLKEKLTLPLGLQNTISEDKNEVIIPNLAKAYNYHKETKHWLENPFIDLSLNRRIFSTVSDLNKWAQAIDNPGWLSKNSLKLMKQNHLREISNNISYGYGWVIFDNENKSEMGDLGISKPYIIHGGSTDGYKSMLINVNEGEYVISLLSNVGNRTNEMELAKKIINILLKNKIHSN